MPSLPLPLFRGGTFAEPGWGAKLGSSFPVPPSHNAGAPHVIGVRFFYTRRTILWLHGMMLHQTLIAARQREAVKPGRHKPSGRGSGLTPKVRKAIEILISADDLNPKNMNDDAAERAGISGRALKAALQKPSVRRFMNEQIEIYRDGLKAVAVRTIGDVMTDPMLKTTAAGARVRLDAAKTALIDNPGSNVNVQVNTQVNITPGYVIDLTEEQPAPFTPIIVENTQP